MKRFALALLLIVGASFFSAQEASAGQFQLGIGVGVARGAVQVQIGGGGFNQRYVAAGQAWVNEPYIYWQSIPDPVTGRIYRVQRIAYTRRLVVLYYDRLLGGYGYFDRYGNPIPYRRY